MDDFSIAICPSLCLVAGLNRLQNEPEKVVIPKS